MIDFWEFFLWLENFRIDILRVLINPSSNIIFTNFKTQNLPQNHFYNLLYTFCKGVMVMKTPLQKIFFPSYFHVFFAKNIN